VKEGLYLTLRQISFHPLSVIAHFRGDT